MNIRQGAWKMGSRQSTILLLQIQRAFRALRKKESEFRIRPPLKESPSSHSCRKRATEGRRKASRGHPPCRVLARYAYIFPLVRSMNRISVSGIKTGLVLLAVAVVLIVVVERTASP